MIAFRLYGTSHDHCNSSIYSFRVEVSCSIPNFTHGLALIIPGNVKNSDLTMPKSTFKNRLADYLLELQSKGDHNIWCQSNIFRS